MSFIHHNRLVRMNDLFHIMSNQYHGNPFHLVQSAHRPYYFLSSVRIQHCRRLIQNNALRMHSDDARNGHSLFLSSRKLIRRMFPVLIHAYGLQAFLHPLPDLLRRHTHILGAESHIFFHYLADNLIIRVLKNHSGSLADFPQILFFGRIFSIHPYRPLRRIKNRVQMLCQRRLTGTIMPKYRHEIALFHIQIHLVHCPGDPLHITFLIPPDIFKNQFLRFNNSHLSPCLQN